ncbi:MAG: hypothetical protein M0R28_20280 [Pigmentiphaga sp.]|nr:hypothetical protein [Pigmentiphaga sp.]
MNLDEITELAEEVIASFDDRIAGLSYREINELLFSLPAEPHTITGKLVRDRLETLKWVMHGE